MQPAKIDGYTDVFRKPGDMSDEECGSLHVKRGCFNGLDTLQSAWVPSPEELQKLNAGQPVILTIIGSGHPPVMLEVQ